MTYCEGLKNILIFPRVRYFILSSPIAPQSMRNRILIQFIALIIVNKDNSLYNKINTLFVVKSIPFENFLFLMLQNSYHKGFLIDLVLLSERSEKSPPQERGCRGQSPLKHE